MAIFNSKRGKNSKMHVLGPEFSKTTAAIFWVKFLMWEKPFLTEKVAKPEEGPRNTPQKDRICSVDGKKGHFEAKKYNAKLKMAIRKLKMRIWKGKMDKNNKMLVLGCKFIKMTAAIFG